MTILAIDTSTQVLSIVLQDENRVYEATRLIGLKHSATLLPLIESLFREADRDVKKVDLIVCAAGPGSFTGLRIGMATAKGLSSGADCAIVSIPTLDAYALPYYHLPCTIMPVIDAKKQHYYTALYRNGERISEYCDTGTGTIRSMIQNEKQVFITGPDAFKLKDIQSDKRVILDPLPERGTGFQLLYLGKKKYSEFGSDGKTTGPFYIRMSDAELLSGGKSV